MWDGGVHEVSPPPAKMGISGFTGLLFNGFDQGLFLSDNIVADGHYLEIVLRYCPF
jgi:hypothetical protein